MARILCISDIHGNAEDLTYLLENEIYDRIFLLGDYIGDLLGYCDVEKGNEVLEIVQTLVASPDNIALRGNHEYMSLIEFGKGHELFVPFMKNMSPEAYIMVDGFSIYMTHDPETLNPQYLSRANIIISGHLHTYGIKNVANVTRAQAGTLLQEGRNPDIAAKLHSESFLPWASGHLGRTYIIIDTQELFLQIRQIPLVQSEFRSWKLIQETTLHISKTWKV